MVQTEAGHRLAMPWRVDRYHAARACDEAQSDNEWLILYCHDVAGEPVPCGFTPTHPNHALEAASRLQILFFNRSEALPCAGA